MVLADDDPDIEDAFRHTASMLQARQLITNNAISKRKEQLSRWATSEMNGASTSRKRTKVQFEDADIFLSACMSGDEDEVEELLDKGADINTATVDGLTALHQSVIDSKPEMVRYLCEKGADLNAQDNEGWTPLHAAACCGNVSIVKFLCQQGADLTIINSDKELALDLAEDESCREFLEADYRRKGIDPDKCRDRELTCMMEDVQRWTREGSFGDVPHPRTGATALHVAAAKGYTQLMEMLLKAGASVSVEDKDGWTPLHAAAHWGEKDSCKILLEHGASVTSGSSEGQSVLSVADKEIVEYLEELEKTVVKKRPPSLPPVKVLAEQNARVEPPQEAVVIPTTATPPTSPQRPATPTHPPHFLTSDQKHALAIKDEREEAEMLHTGAKHPRLVEKSPDLGGTETEDSSENQQSGDSQASQMSSERMSVERSQSAVVSSPSRERSVELSPDVVVRQPPIRTSTVSVSERAERPSVTADRPAQPASTSVERKSSTSSSDNAVSATVSLRSSQQPASWINRGVPLTSSRTPSLGSSASCSSEAVDESEEVESEELESEEMLSEEEEGTSASCSSATPSASPSHSLAVASSASAPHPPLPDSSYPLEHSVSGSMCSESVYSEEEEQTHSSEELVSSEERSSEAGFSSKSMSEDATPSTSTTHSEAGDDGASSSDSGSGPGPSSHIDSASSEPPSAAHSAPGSVVDTSASGSPTVHLTVRPPPSSGVSASGATVARSASTPSTLPWVRSVTSGGTTTTATSSSSNSAASLPVTTTSSVPSSTFSSFLQRDRVSAFRPPVKTSTSTVSSTGSSSIIGRADATLPPPVSPSRATFKPQPLSAPMMRPWQASSANATNESEAERRKEARMHRQFRRSTQGVTKEQLEEASRVAAEEQARRRGIRGVRLASEEKDTSPDTENDQVDQHSHQNNAPATPPSATSPSTSATLSLPASVFSPNSTPSAANIRRKNQAAVGASATGARAGRRGTGPVLAEDVHAAVSLRCVAPATLPSSGAPTQQPHLPQAGYTTSLGAHFQSGASSGFPLLRPAQESSTERHEKSHSAPPPHAAGPPQMTTALRTTTGVAPLPSRQPPQSRVTAALGTNGDKLQNGQATQQATMINYKTLYEQQKCENERLRKEMEEQRRISQNGNVRRSTSASTASASNTSMTASASTTRTVSSGVVKSGSGTSLDDNERRQFERRISDLEYELKALNQLRMENQRLKEENGALVRVISKMTI